MLLMRYGVALEYNKYDHVYLRQDFLPFIEKYNVIKQKLAAWKNIPQFKIFKIKATAINLALIYFHRAKEFDFTQTQV
jgi:hypothetical protein